MIGIPDSRNSSQSPGREELFSAGLTYMESGEYGFAYYCLSNIENPDIAVLYNMAYCCYRISWYEQSYSLLKDAELKLPGLKDVSTDRLPAAFQRWELETNDTFSPMPAKVYPWMSAIQLFRLKAEVASRLQLTADVRRITSYLGGKFNHINKLINQ